ncbi:PDZK1-interacting protein 1 [Oncorhynchus mykiss]|uniref:PDZK1-interacting protein 1 n=1 Tax=Oncorhynchus mykiss TaxID=8022 RepID=UPI0018779F6F|nr:PDZK1-interacting protein 1 [Oncorhynchus mykiss]XP_036833774.1 PDZK1-interacting protein 1 [Oncorhynchus mykiss]
MGRATKGILWLMLTLGVVTAQIVKVDRTLPQWLTGIIAVVVFLFLIFVAFLVNKAWCQDSRLETKVCECVETTGYGKTNRDNYNTSLDTVRNGDDEGAYENMALESVEDKATAM